MKESDLEIAQLRKDLAASEQRMKDLSAAAPRRLDDTRSAVVHKFTVGATKGYLEE